MTIFGAFILALLLALLFAPGYRRGSYSPLLVFFFILFMAGVASNYWIAPFGPVWLGVSWFPVFFILLICTLLFVAPSPYDRRGVSKANNVESAAVSVISIYVWLIFIVLLIAIIAGVLRTAP